MKKLGLVCINSSIGMVLLLDNYSEYLKQYFHVFVITNMYYENKSEQLKFHKIIRPLTNILTGLQIFNPIIWIRLLWILMIERPSIIYIISASAINPLIIILAKLLNPKITIISHIHDVIAHLGTQNEFWINLIQRIQILLTNHFTVFGPTLKQMMIRYHNIPYQAILSIKHGVTRSLPEQAPAQVRDPIICFIGRIDEYKDIASFLKVAEYFDYNGNMSFILGGQGDLSYYHSQIVARSNLTVVNRFLTNAEVDDIFRKSLVALLPYKDASQSGVVPIAFYNGCPVIITDVGGLPENIIPGWTGFIVPRGDVDAMVAKIKFLLANPTSARQISASCYNYYLTELQFSEIFKEIVKNINQWIV